MTNPIAIRYNGQQKSTSDRPQMTIEIDYNYFWEGLSQESKEEIAFRCAYDQSVMMHIVNEICSYDIPLPTTALIENNKFKSYESSGGCGNFVQEIRQAIAPLASEATAIEMDRLKKENQELQKYKKCLTDYMWAWRNYDGNSVSYHQCREKMEELTGISLSRS